MANRPGVMFYFEVRPCLKRLSLEEKGALFEAILDYGEFGVVPELDGAAAIAWDFIQPRIDKDGERYENTVKQREYAVYVREIKKKGNEPLSFDEWKSWKDNETNQSVSTDNGSYPTANSIADSYSKSTINLQSQQTTAAESETETETKITAFRRVNHDPDVDFERKRQEQIERLARYCGAQ